MNSVISVSVIYFAVFLHYLLIICNLPVALYTARSMFWRHIIMLSANFILLFYVVNLVVVQC